MAVVSLENNIKIYSSELSHALLKVSNYKLDARIAQTVAKNLITKIKQEYFNS